MSEPAFRPDSEPFAGFELTVVTDRTVYAPGDVVRCTVSATNASGRFTTHAYPGWQRFVLTVRDESHRAVASDEVTVAPAGGSVPFVERWLPGQMLLLPTYWNQTTGAVRPDWATAPPGPRVEPGRYRLRVGWLGREPGALEPPPDVFSPWFEVV